VVERLERYPLPAVEAWALVALRSAAREKLAHYLGEWRYVKPFLDGRALARLGIARGPLMGDVLRLLKVARLDGQASGRQEEVELVRGVLAGRVEVPGAEGGQR
jgi:tRNA nucleotidyltransferase (CCA-adding enzyme)